MGIGLLVARAVLGLALAAHGAQKLLGWWGGFGLEKTTGFMGAVGFRPPKLFALAVSLGEIGAGFLIALGLLGPVGPALAILMMLVAIGVAHWGHGFFAAQNGVELPLLYATAALTFDHLLGLESLSTPATAWGAIVLGVLGAGANLALRRPAPKAVTA